MTPTALPLRILGEETVLQEVEEDLYEEAFSERGCLSLLCFGRLGFGPRKRQEIADVEFLLNWDTVNVVRRKRSRSAKEMLSESVEGLKAQCRNYRPVALRKPAFWYDQESYELNFDGGDGA